MDCHFHDFGNNSWIVAFMGYHNCLYLSNILAP